MSKKIKKELQKSPRIHFTGILGNGMMPLARLLLSRGYTVSGSDLREPESPLPEGMSFSRGHAPEMISGDTLCVHSLAVPYNDPELCRAREVGATVISRPELLGALAASYPVSVGVAGSHGKSTVTAMLAELLSPISPTVICGADIGESGLVAGVGDLFVYEACEYRDAFLSARPNVAVLLNLELDHTDYFSDVEMLADSFHRFAASARRVIYNADDPRLATIATSLGERAVGFGSSPSAEYRFEITERRSTMRFVVIRRGTNIGEFALSLLGDFNVYNALAAIAVACELGISSTDLVAPLADFRGIPRRLENIGTLCGIPVIYDYAHHPTEISAGIRALRESGASHITVVFRPHTYSRTAALWDDFVDALSLADRVILTDVYAARESAIEGIDSARLAAAIGEQASYAESAERALELLRMECTDRIILMGAGDLSEIKNKIKNT